MSKIFKFLIGLPNYLYHNHKVKNIDYFDYRRLVSPNHKIPYGFGSVLNYGNWKAVAKLKGSSFNFLTEYLEHGASFLKSTESVQSLGYPDRPGIKKIYTISAFRKNVIKQYLTKKGLTDRDVVAVGPYIMGVKNFHDKKKMKEIKDKYGRILLVMPSHSNTILTKYNSDEFTDFIESKKGDFDSVFICMYWKDLLEKPNEVAFYEKLGYIVVCNGHRHDPMFMSRQRDLLELADMLMTNQISSCIGYAVALGIPVCYFNQDVYYFTPDEESKKTLDEVKLEVIHLFGKYSFEITKEQKYFVEKYFGKEAK